MSLLNGAVFGLVIVIVSNWYGVGLLCLLGHQCCVDLCEGDLLDDLLEDLLLRVLWLDLLVSYLWLFVWLFVFLALHKCEKCPTLLHLKHLCPIAGAVPVDVAVPASVT